MNIRTRIFIGLIVSALFAFFTLIVFAEDRGESAKLPYDGLFQLQETISKKLPRDQPVYLRLFSDTPGVKSSDITIHLVSKKEKTEIPLDSCGYFDLPIRKDLVGQGAYVVTNQPRGTMVLRGELKLQIPLQNRLIKYEDLISPVITADSVKKIAQGVTEIASGEYMDSLHLTIDQDGAEPVIIRLPDEKPILLIPDEFGNVIIPVEERLIKENPVVEFPSDNVFHVTPLE